MGAQPTQECGHPFKPVDFTSFRSLDPWSLEQLICYLGSVIIQIRYIARVLQGSRRHEARRQF